MISTMLESQSVFFLLFFPCFFFKDGYTGGNSLILTKNRGNNFKTLGTTDTGAVSKGF